MLLLGGGVVAEQVTEEAHDGEECADGEPHVVPQAVVGRLDVVEVVHEEAQHEQRNHEDAVHPSPEPVGVERGRVVRCHRIDDHDEHHDPEQSELEAHVRIPFGLRCVLLVLQHNGEVDAVQDDEHRVEAKKQHECEIEIVAFHVCHRYNRNDFERQNEHVNAPCRYHVHVFHVCFLLTRRDSEQRKAACVFFVDH